MEMQNDHWYFRIANATQTKNNICVNCRVLVAHTPELRRSYSQAYKSFQPGDKLSIQQSTDIFIYQNVFCWSNRHAICNQCAAKNARELDIQVICVPEDSIANENWKRVYSITNNARQRLKTLLDTELKQQETIHDNKVCNRSNSKNNCVQWKLLSNIDCQIFTRLSIEQINKLANKYNLDPSDIFIVLILSICKSNLSYRVASKIFGPSPTSIKNIFYHVLDTLYDRMVPEHLGTSWTCAKISIHTPDYAKTLLQLQNNQIVYTCDGFPIYIEKCRDFDIQKLTYSGKSKRNCLTFHGCVTLDGHFIYINGPYGSDGYNNDQNIFNTLFDRKYNASQLKSNSSKNNNSNNNNSNNNKSNNNKSNNDNSIHNNFIHNNCNKDNNILSNNNSNNSNNSNNNTDIDNNDNLHFREYMYDNDNQTIHLSLQLTKNGDIIILDKGLNNML